MLKERRYKLLVADAVSTITKFGWGGGGEGHGRIEHTRILDQQPEHANECDPEHCICVADLERY